MASSQYCCVSGNREVSEEGERWENGWAVEQSEPTHLLINFAVFYGRSSWHPKIITIVTSTSTDHHNKYNNHEKVGTIARITKTRHEVSKCCWKNGADRPAPCTVATNLQFVKTLKSGKGNKVKRNKTGHVCVTKEN